MKFTLMRRGHMVQILVGCIGLVLLIVFATGCCDVKVEEPDGKILLIVKRDNNLPPPQTKPDGALIDVTKLKTGDELLLINRFGSAVTVKFQVGIIEGEHKFDIEKCGQRRVTIELTDPNLEGTTVLLTKKGTLDHGGADMILEPPGGG